MVPNSDREETAYSRDPGLSRELRKAQKVMTIQYSHIQNALLLWCPCWHWSILSFTSSACILVGAIVLTEVGVFSSKGVRKTEVHLITSISSSVGTYSSSHTTLSFTPRAVACLIRFTISLPAGIKDVSIFCSPRSDNDMSMYENLNGTSTNVSSAKRSI